MSIAVLAFMSPAFSRARSRVIFQLSCQLKYELVINLKTAKALGLYCASFAGRSCRRRHPMKLAMSAYDPKQK